MLADGATSSKFSKPLVQTTLEECDTEDDKDICLFLISQDGNIIERVSVLDTSNKVNNFNTSFFKFPNVIYITANFILS